MKKRLLLLGLVPLFALGSCQKGGNSSENASSNIDYSEKTPESFVEVSKEKIRDKVLGGWIGHAIGIGSGFEYVRLDDNWSDLGKIEGETVEGKTAIFALADKYWEPNGTIAAGSIGCNPYHVRPISDPRVLKGVVYSDDDIHVDILNQFIFRDYGPTLGPNDITSAWKFYDVHDVGGGQYTRTLTHNSNYVTPYTGQSTYGNNGYLITESWIENETLGLTFPYMYDTALGYADMFTQVQGDAYAYYLGKLSAMMYALSFEYDDATVCLEKAFDFIPKNNNLYSMYKLVLKCYEKKINWRTAAKEIVKQSVNCNKAGIADAAGFSLDANAGMIFLGIVYGQNDFEESIKITSLAGLDGDCTCATVGGLLGACLGFSKLPQKYRDFLNGKSIYYNHTGSNGYATGVYWGAFAYCGANFPNSLTFDAITNLTVQNIEDQIINNHGSIEEDKYKIPYQGYNPVEQVEVKNFSFEDGTIDGWVMESSNEESTFSASSVASHLGEFGGLVILPDVKDTAKVYQNIKLTKGNTYKASIWLNKTTDREFKFFAKDNDNHFFRTYVNPVSLGKFHMKAELYFQASSDNMDIGVDFCETYEDAYSTTICIDDLIVSDITRTVTNHNFQAFEAEQANTNGKIIENEKYSNKSAVKLESDDYSAFNIASNGEVQAIKIFYDNNDTYYGAVSILIDDKEYCVVPLVSTGVNNYFNTSNYARVDLYIPEGQHELKVTYISFAEIILDRVEISNANYLLEK